VLVVLEKGAIIYEGTLGTFLQEDEFEALQENEVLHLKRECFNLKEEFFLRYGENL